jgi:HK97 family phage prohead protease
MSRIERSSFGGGFLSIGGAAAPESVGFQVKVAAAGEIRGYATLWNKPHVYNGGFDVFRPGCFARSLIGQKAIRLLIDHDESNLLATSADGLELLGDDTGLAFRCDMSRVDARSRDRIGSRRAMSVGYFPLAVEEKRVAGETVRFIEDANLTEISLCTAGAVKEAFAIFTSSSLSEPLREVCERKALLREGAFDKLMDAHRRLLALVSENNQG